MYIIIEYMKQTICIYAFAALLLGGCKSNNELTIPTNLRTEYLTEPIGLDTSSPRFTWEYSGNEEALRLPAMSTDRYESGRLAALCGRNGPETSYPLLLECYGMDGEASVRYLGDGFFRDR